MAAELTCCGKNIHLDEHGHLQEYEQWDDCVAECLARNEGIEHLTSEQKEIVRFMRKYYEKHHFFPILNYVCREVHQGGKCVYNEFDNPEKAWRIAGLPKVEGVNFVKLDGQHYIMEDYC